LPIDKRTGIRYSIVGYTTAGGQLARPTIRKGRRGGGRPVWVQPALAGGRHAG